MPLGRNDNSFFTKHLSKGMKEASSLYMIQNEMQHSRMRHIAVPEYVTLLNSMVQYSTMQ